jgi:hypothetical protein
MQRRILLALALAGCSSPTSTGWSENAFQANPTQRIQPTLYIQEYGYPQHIGWVHITGGFFPPNEVITVGYKHWECDGAFVCNGDDPTGHYQFYPSETIQADSVGNVSSWVYHQYWWARDYHAVWMIFDSPGYHWEEETFAWNED